MLREKHLPVDIVHLVALDQGDNVEVLLKLILASIEENSLLLGERVAHRAPTAEASAEVGANGDNPIRRRLGELFAVHNKLIEEVELLGLGLLADVEALPLVVLLDELLHAIRVKFKLLQKCLGLFAVIIVAFRRLRFCLG